MAHNVTSDVEYLRHQYNAGKSKNNGLAIQYHNKQFHDGDELKRSETQAEPNVNILIDSDPQQPYFTLVNLFWSFFLIIYFALFYCLDHG